MTSGGSATHAAAFFERNLDSARTGISAENCSIASIVEGFKLRHWHAVNSGHCGEPSSRRSVAKSPRTRTGEYR